MHSGCAGQVTEQFLHLPAPGGSSHGEVLVLRSICTEQLTCTGGGQYRSEARVVLDDAVVL